MGELPEDVKRCLCECACAADVAERARRSCEEGRPRETKRVLLGERQRLLDEMHASQRGIDAIDHLLHRVGCECKLSRASGQAGPRDADARETIVPGPCDADERGMRGEVAAHE